MPAKAGVLTSETNCDSTRPISKRLALMVSSARRMSSKSIVSPSCFRIISSAKSIAGLMRSGSSHKISKGDCAAGKAVLRTFVLRFFDDCNDEFAFFDIARNIGVFHGSEMRLQNGFEQFVVLR